MDARYKNCIIYTLVKFLVNVRNRPYFAHTQMKNTLLVGWETSKLTDVTDKLATMKTTKASFLYFQ